MADRDKARHRKRLKREKKRRELARRERQHEQTLTWATGEAQCYITADWIERGMGNLMVLRESARGGQWAFAGFLIDTYCIGLKDVMSTDDYTPEDFHDIIMRARSGQELAAISLDEARKLVAAAVVWTRTHRFRLPKGWDKAASILGGLGDIGSADVSKFGYGGGLYYMGRIEDLAVRLIDESVEDFLARPGVHYTFGVDPEGVADREALDKLQAGIEDAGEQLAEAARMWCDRVGQKPEEALDVACQIVIVALLESAQEDDTLELIQQEVVRQRALELAEENDEENPDKASIRPAVEQVIEFARSAEGQKMIGEVTMKGK